MRTSRATAEPLEESKSYECKRCKDELGYLITAEDGTKELWHICECVSERRQKRLLKSSNITEEFQKFDFENFTIANRPQCVLKAYEKAKFYADQFKNIQEQKSRVIGITFLGIPGSGKTHLLTAVANSLLTRGIEVLYFPWVDGSNELRNTVRQKADVQAQIDHMKSVQVLYIDDLFKGRKEPSEFQLEWLFEVVNFRYLNRLPMLVSSEKYIHQILEIDEGIGRRIYERSRDFKVDMILAKGEEGMQLNYSIMSNVI